MSANLSPGKQRRNIMATPLSVLTGFDLIVDCPTPSCGGRRSVAMEALTRQQPDGTVAAAIRAMRCATCGKGTAAVWVRNRREGREMQLTGPGLRV